MLVVLRNCPGPIEAKSKIIIGVLFLSTARRAPLRSLARLPCFYAIEELLQAPSETSSLWAAEGRIVQSLSEHLDDDAEPVDVKKSKLRSLLSVACASPSLLVPALLPQLVNLIAAKDPSVCVPALKICVELAKSDKVARVCLGTPRFMTGADPNVEFIVDEAGLLYDDDGNIAFVDSDEGIAEVRATIAMAAQKIKAASLAADLVLRLAGVARDVCDEKRGGGDGGGGGGGGGGEKRGKPLMEMASV